MMTNRLASLLMAASAVAILGACSGDITSTQSGHMSAMVTDNPSSTSPTASMTPSSGFAPMADYRGTAQSVSGTSSSAFSGSMSSSMKVAISADGQSWIDICSPVQNTLQLQSTGDTTTLASRTSVPVGTYAYVRLTIDGANAQVTGSFGGIAYTDAQISVANGGQIVIEKQVQPFTITANTNATVIFDLNSELWITAQSVQSHAATAAEMAVEAGAAVE